jgi:hypothetical protein
MNTTTQPGPLEVRLSDQLGAWQPIATAPRDGTRVLIYMPEASRQKVMEADCFKP